MEEIIDEMEDGITDKLLEFIELDTRIAGLQEQLEKLKQDKASYAKQIRARLIQEVILVVPTGKRSGFCFHLSDGEIVYARTTILETSVQP
ncbi:hypothetical protein [Gloeothece verrucosa]|uniref:Uncharacterized protein n=1 Tax=Gloeothece verrucosa (strain PCC 7822) TaxID=497965 RepID=E0UD20_GLOV7|nr:hypothetical protein [Gloeothece verrucosa]ADN16485.1 hypothetical protein Cyan7822_4576 [Gloeothece verrucosa PCC 7822]